ncbi:hypothetical protein DPEC_G00284210 [Dallia pectoralis]|uniref:Uncharacterized protein n=1 Tax=Dallia pectoralis TaxID=75939 RepID=A0ACC2FJF0_DALPE|nr:hypothetical protein DPEC_G00284210 [Dallia pectoralis]
MKAEFSECDGIVIRVISDNPEKTPVAADVKVDDNTLPTLLAVNNTTKTLVIGLADSVHVDNIQTSLASNLDILGYVGDNFTKMVVDQEDNKDNMQYVTISPGAETVVFVTDTPNISRVDDNTLPTLLAVNNNTKTLVIGLADSVHVDNIQTSLASNFDILVVRNEPADVQTEDVMVIHSKKNKVHRFFKRLCCCFKSEDVME